MRDARPGTRMTVVDWSGRRMLATRGRAGLGPESWGLLRRLALREGFGGITARWEGPRLLASGIAEALAGWITGARERPWDFLADAPEGEVLALWTPAAEGEVAPAVGRRGRRPGLFPARTGAPRMAPRPVRPRRIAGVTSADRAVAGPPSSRPARHAAPLDRGGPGLPTGPAVAGAPGGPLRAVPGRRIMEVGADLAADVWGFVRLRSGVPMGTAGTPEAGPARGGLLRTVDLAAWRETRFEAGGGPEWPEVGTTAWSRGPAGAMAGQPFLPGPARGVAAGFRRSAAGAGFDAGAGVAWRPRTPGRAPGEFTRGILASVARFAEPSEGGGASDLAVKRPEAAFLAFSRHRAGESEAPAVFPERVATRREVVPPESGTTRSGRGPRRVAAREAESRRATPEGVVARATFTPRRAHAEAPWFAPPAQPAPVFGRSLWSAVMGPASFGEFAPRKAGSPTYSMSALEAAMTGVPFVAARPGAANAERRLTPSRRVGEAHVGSRQPRGVPIGAPWDLGADAPERAWSSVGTMGSNLVRMMTAAWAAERDDAALIGLAGPSAPFAPGGPGRVYPERPAARAGDRATGGNVADTAAGGVRTATFSPRRAGVVEAPGASPDVWMADEVLAAVGMKAFARGEAVGAQAPVFTPWTGWVPEGPRIAVTETMLSRADRGGFAPWAFAGAGERAFLALPGMVRSEAGTPPGGIATSGPRSPAAGSRVATTPALAGTRAARIAVTGLAEPGPYGTTPLARLMALGTVRADRGRTEGTGLLGASEAGDWMLDGLLRLGLRGEDARPEASRVAGRMSAAETGSRPGAGARPGAASAGSRRVREPDVRTDAGAKGRRGRPQFAATERYGETLVTRTLASREVPGQGTVGAASRPTSSAADVARAEAATPWGFAGDVDEVFLRFPWADRLEDVDRAVAPTVTRVAGAAGRPGWRGSVADTPRGRNAGSRPVAPERPPTTRAGAATSPIVRASQPMDVFAGAAPREMGSRSRRPRDLQSAADERTGEISITRLRAGEAVSGPWTSPDGRTGWGGPATVAGDEATLLVMARPPERGAEGREAAGWTGSRGGTGAIPAGAMWFIQRTLGRALRALPPEAWGEAGPRAVESGLVPADLAGLLGIVPAKTLEARAETAEAGRRSERAGGAVGDLVSPPGTDATAGEPARTVRPERIEARTPGLPEEPVILEMSLGDTGPAGPVVGPGTVPSLSGLIRAGETPGPALRGLPLVAPAMSAVASQARMSRRSEGPAARPTRTPDAQAPAAGSQAAGSQPIDLDVLAIEMAERILRRMKRDKERRGHHD